MNHVEGVPVDLSLESLKSHTFITGSTGAGQKPGSTTHFSWRNNNLSIYKAFKHQHIPEIRESLTQVQGHLEASIDFIPYRGDFWSAIYLYDRLRFSVKEDDALCLFSQKQSLFTLSTRVA